MDQYPEQLDGIFQALADPTRRAVLGRLGKGPASISDLAKPFDMALPSFMKHIHFLEGSGLIRTRKQGRVRTCAIEKKRFAAGRSVAVRATRPLGRPHRQARAVRHHQPTRRKNRNDLIAKSGSRPDDIARHQGAAVGRLERLDGPGELRAMVGSGAGQMQGRGNGPSSRRLVRDADQRERRRFHAASERLLPRHRRWRTDRLHRMRCSADGGLPSSPS